MQHIINIRSPDINIQLNAISRIPEVAEIIGSNRTVFEFLPYLAETCGCSEKVIDCMLNSISKIDFTKYSDTLIIHLLHKLKNFAEVNSKAVQNSFVNCIQSIIKTKTQSNSVQLITDYITTLFEDEWYVNHLYGFGLLNRFSHYILPGSFNNLIMQSLNLLPTDSDLQIYLEFMKVCQENINLLNDECLQVVVNKVIELKNSSYDSVIFRIPKFIASYSCRMKTFDKSLHIFKELLESPNWMIRFYCVSSINIYFELENPPIADFLSIISSVLANEKEDEIRIIAAEQIQYFSKFKDIDKDSLMKIIDLLCDDKCQHCRTSLANCLFKFSHVLEEQYITNVMIKLIADQSELVKSAAIESINNKHISGEDIIKEIMKNECEWREKRSIPHILCSLNDEELITDLIKKLITDDSIAVRKEMIKCVPEIIEKFGNDFMENKICPIIKEIASSDEYELRQTAIMLIIKAKLFNEKGLEIINKCLNDKVSNVRLVIAKYLPRTFTDIIEKLKNDEDCDVREYANCDKSSDL